MIETDLQAYLIANTAVKALVVSRVYPLVLPQDSEIPALTYQRISGPRVRSLKGPSNLAHPRIMIKCYGRTYLSAKTVAAAVRVALDGYRGTMGSTVVGDVILDGEDEDLEQDTGLYWVSMDFIIWHKE